MLAKLAAKDCSGVEKLLLLLVWTSALIESVTNNPAIEGKAYSTIITNGRTVQINSIMWFCVPNFQKSEYIRSQPTKIETTITTQIWISTP